MSDHSDRKLVAVVRPNKPISQMTEAELTEFAERLAAATEPTIRAQHEQAEADRADGNRDAA